MPASPRPLCGHTPPLARGRPGRGRRVPSRATPRRETRALQGSRRRLAWFRREEAFRGGFAASALNRGEARTTAPDHRFVTSRRSPSGLRLPNPSSLPPPPPIPLPDVLPPGALVPRRAFRARPAAAQRAPPRAPVRSGGSSGRPGRGSRAPLPCPHVASGGRMSSGLLKSVKLKLAGGAKAEKKPAPSAGVEPDVAPRPSRLAAAASASQSSSRPTENGGDASTSSAAASAGALDHRPRFPPLTEEEMERQYRGASGSFSCARRRSSRALVVSIGRFAPFGRPVATWVSGTRSHRALT